MSLMTVCHGTREGIIYIWSFKKYFWSSTFILTIYPSRRYKWCNNHWAQSKKKNCFYHAFIKKKILISVIISHKVCLCYILLFPNVLRQSWSFQPDHSTEASLRWTVCSEVKKMQNLKASHWSKSSGLQSQMKESEVISV